MAKTVFNKITNERWLCDNFEDSVLIEGRQFVQVYRADRPTPVLMNRESLQELVTNDMEYASPQIHG